MSRRKLSVLLRWKPCLQQGRIVLNVVGLLMISACSFTSGPSKRDALAQIQAAYLKLNECVEYSNIRFDHGFERDSDNYVVVVSYHLLFKRDVVSITQKEYDSFLCGSLGAALLKQKYFDAKLGNMYEEIRQFRFMLTDDGWKVRGEIYE